MSYYRYPVNKIGITSDYGYRTETQSFHYGLDLGWMDYKGENIYSIGNGEIIKKGYTSLSGNYVIIKHNESDKSKYLHMKDPSLLNVGDIVSTGTLIGYMGTTGSSTGVHLHVEIVRNGSNIDPKTVLYVYEDQIVGENTKKKYKLLYKDSTNPDDIQILKNKLLEKEKEITNLKEKITELENPVYKFSYFVKETDKYKIKLNKGENLIIK